MSEVLNSFASVSVRALAARAFDCWQSGQYSALAHGARLLDAIERGDVVARERYERRILRWVDEFTGEYDAESSRERTLARFCRGAAILTRLLYNLPPLGRETRVFSGLGQTAAKALAASPCTATLVVAGPLATTYDLKVAATFSHWHDGERYVLDIAVPPSAQGLEYLRHSPGQQLTEHEQELLLPSGTRLALTGETEDLVVEHFDDWGDVYDRQSYTLVKAELVAQRIPRWALPFTATKLVSGQ